MWSLQALTRLLRGDLFSKCKSIIVYCTRREQTTRVAALIRNAMRTYADDDSEGDGEGNRTPPRYQKSEHVISDSVFKVFVLW